ncbi:MAG: DUF3052 family protein [Rhodospirillaceae bacterium]|nr:DUF3052 family protein [Rhodospirillaceae bacterium]
MGQEIRCFGRMGREAGEGRAYLGSDRVTFRGAFRLDLPFTEIRAIEAKAGALALSFAGGKAVFDLGETAAKWAEKIRNPTSLLDKLGVTPQSRLCVIGVDDEGFLADLTRRVGAFRLGRPSGKEDIIFLAADTEAELSRLDALKGRLSADGALWVVSKKGKSATIKDVRVMACAKAAGFVDTKVASFPATHTALKLVIPRAARPRP